MNRLLHRWVSFVLVAVMAASGAFALPGAYAEEEPAAPVVLEELDEPGEPNEPGEPTKPNEPGEPNDPDEPGDPNDPDEPGDPDDPEEPADPGDPEGDPDEPDAPGISQMFAAFASLFGGLEGEVVIVEFHPEPYANPDDPDTHYIVVDTGTPIDRIPLPMALAATVEGGEQYAYSVDVAAWECADYDPDVPGVYVFEPLLALGEGVSLAAGVVPPAVEVVVTAGMGMMAASAGAYNAGDVAVINNIIAVNGLAWTLAPVDGSSIPGDWTGVTWDGAATDQRIMSLDIKNKGLTGALEVSGLTELGFLNCDDNNLNALNVTQNLALTWLSFGNNNISVIDVTKNPALTWLSAYNNILSTLDVTKNPALTDLDVGRNNLSVLDLTSNPALDYLGFAYNPIAHVKLTGGYEMTFDVKPSRDAVAWIDIALGNTGNPGEKAIGIVMEPKEGYAFVEWTVTGVPDSKIDIDDNLIDIILPPSPVTITANFVSTSGSAFVPVTSINGLPTVTSVGVPITLFGVVTPSHATNQTITWSVIDAGTTGATVTGNTANFPAAGTATLMATIANGSAVGTDYTRSFTIAVSTIPVFVPVTGIAGLPSAATVGTPLTLSGTVTPSNADNKTITWSVASAGTTGATVSGNIANFTAAGSAMLVATVADGSAVGIAYTRTFTITVSAAPDGGNPPPPAASVSSAPFPAGSQAVWALSVRSRPGGGKIVGRLRKGDGLTVLGVSGRFAHIEWSGGTGYVDANRLSISYAAPVEARAASRGVLFKKMNGSRVSGLPTFQKGDTLYVLSKTARWYQVSTADGAVGWVPASRVKVSF